MVSIPQNTKNLFAEVKQLIEEAKQSVAVTVNATTTLLYWNIGKSVNSKILDSKRAKYSTEVVKSLSETLTQEYGKGWSEKQLRHCLRIAETFPDKKILYALSRQLSWTHLRTIMYLKDEIKREFYIGMTRIENWNTRTLNEKMINFYRSRKSIIRKRQPSIFRQFYTNPLSGVEIC